MISGQGSISFLSSLHPFLLSFFRLKEKNAYVEL